MNAMTVKLIVALVLAAAWVALAFAGKTDVAPLVTFIQLTLTGLAAHTLTMIDPGRRPPPPSEPAAAPANPQAGFARPVLLLILAGNALAMIGGCASLQNAGSSTLTLKPMVIDAKTGATVCCEVAVADGKQRASLTLTATKTGDNYAFSLDEKGVEAFQGQAIAAGATQEAIDAAARAAAAAALAPVLPALLPALSATGAGSAVLGAGGLLGAQKLLGSGAAAAPTMPTVPGAK